MLTFYHAPHSRSSVTEWLIAELGAPHEVAVVDIRAPGGAPESYRAIQPHRKVPAIVHDGVTITERAAIALHLADAFPGAGLAPPAGDPKRGPYTSWLVYADAVLDPAIVARRLGWSETSGASFGLLEDALAHIARTLGDGPYLLGQRFTAADVAIGSALFWGTEILKLIPARPVFRDYLGRLAARPAFQRTMGARQPVAA